MIKFYNTLTNTRGDSLPNYRVQVTNSAGTVQTIYADSGGTRFTDGDGNNVNYATADNNGFVEFYWTPAAGQVLQTLDTSGDLVKSVADFADQYVLASLTGPIAQSAVTDLVADQAAQDTLIAAKANTADLASTASGEGAALVGYSQGGTGAVATTVDGVLKRTVWAEDYGLAEGASAADNAAAILAAVVALRSNSVTLSTDGLGSGSFTAYASGILRIGEGNFDITPDTLQFTQDIGLTILGSGSRRTTNYIQGKTTLRVVGSSSGYAIQCYANGARGLTLRDLDLTYDDATFTGDLLDVYSTPGVTIERCYIGTDGTSAGTRAQTARSAIRTTYDEFLHVKDTVIDGVIDGWWSDDTREPSPSFSDFGGSVALFENVLVYDVTGSGYRHDGNRTRSTLSFINCVINPIAVDCTRGWKLDNIDGLNMIGCKSAGSVANKATTEWLRAVTCTGVIHGNGFNDLSKAGTLGGALDIRGNRLFCTDGFTLVGGPITGGANEIRKGTAGFTFSPASQLTAVIGPDTFENTVTYSYDVPVDSAIMDVKILYSASSDGSANKFRNVSNRVSITAAAPKLVTVSSATYTISRLDTGNIIAATGTAAQTFTLPTAEPGIDFTVRKLTSQDLTVSRPSGTTLHTGAGASKDTISAVAADYGGSLKFEGQSGPTYFLARKIGNWTEA